MEERLPSRGLRGARYLTSGRVLLITPLHGLWAADSVCLSPNPKSVRNGPARTSMTVTTVARTCVKSVNPGNQPGHGYGRLVCCAPVGNAGQYCTVPVKLQLSLLNVDGFLLFTCWSLKLHAKSVESACTFSSRTVANVITNRGWTGRPVSFGRPAYFSRPCVFIQH